MVLGGLVAKNAFSETNPIFFDNFFDTRLILRQHPQQVFCYFHHFFSHKFGKGITFSNIWMFGHRHWIFFAENWWRIYLSKLTTSNPVSVTFAKCNGWDGPGSAYKVKKPLWMKIQNLCAISFPWSNICCLPQSNSFFSSSMVSKNVATKSNKCWSWFHLDSDLLSNGSPDNQVNLGHARFGKTTRLDFNV